MVPDDDTSAEALASRLHSARLEDLSELDLNVEDEADGPLEWDWDIEHADRKREAAADAALGSASAAPLPFEVDRRVLKDIVREKMGTEAGRITFLSSGTFHKAYLVTLVNRIQIVARVARRFMPRLKTESEVATMQYLHDHTNVPVPVIYHYDSNPYNRLGGEWILMSKARGIPLSQVYHSMSYPDLVKLMNSLVAILIPLFALRFTKCGSLYFGPDPDGTGQLNILQPQSSTATPKALQNHYGAMPFSPTIAAAVGRSSPSPGTTKSKHILKGLSGPDIKYHVGPIISWPFFGSNRGDLTHPTEINRGPWTTTKAYLSTCVDREVDGVILENEGKAAPHKLHLDPDEIHASRHHHMRAVPGDESDDSDEWDLEESEDEWEGPGDVMYRDYRRMQRSTFLVAHMNKREEQVRNEMGRWRRIMDRLLDLLAKDISNTDFGARTRLPMSPAASTVNLLLEEFGLDCHDLSLENVFVDPKENHKITCIIDWESTTTRPLWACAHLPAFLQSSPFTAKLFLDAVVQLAKGLPPAGDLASKRPDMRQHTLSKSTDSISSMSSITSTHSIASAIDLAILAREWLFYESSGTRLRMAHRFVEWDGWEEGLADSILGVEEYEEEWFKEDVPTSSGAVEKDGAIMSPSLHSAGIKPGGFVGVGVPGDDLLHQALTRKKPAAVLPSKLIGEQLSKGEQMLNITGDVCGGRGGELGRRLEAWLSTNTSESDVNGGEGDGSDEGAINGKPVRPAPLKRWLTTTEDVAA